MNRRNLGVLLCVSALLFLVSCSRPNPSVPKQSPQVAIMELSHNLYFARTTDGTVHAIGDPARLKGRPVMSPDKRRAAFLYTERNTDGHPVLGIFDPATGQVKDMAITDDYGQQASNLRWTGRRTILVEGHVNPDVTGYVLCNADTGKEVNACGGVLYQVLPDEKSMLIRLTPHVFPPIKANLAIAAVKNKERMLYQLYEVPGTQDQIIDARVSTDMSRITFITMLGKDGTAYFNTAKLSPDMRTISSLKSTLMPASPNPNRPAVWL